MSRHTLLVALIASLTALDARPPAWKPPAGWTKVIDAQFTSGEMMVADDGYLSWVESKLDESTKHFRAQSFDRRLYRFRVGEKKAEQIHRTGGTKTYWPLIGPGGAVVTRFDYPKQHLFLPGQPAAELPHPLCYNPRTFVEGGLLCHAQRYSGEKGEYDSALALVPIVGGKARPADARQLMPWHRGRYTDDGFFLYGVFRVGNRLIYSIPGPDRVPKGKGKVKPGTPMLTVWDEVKKEKSWDAEGRPVAADDRYVYSVERDVLVRRALEGEGKAERMTLPAGELYAFRGHRMLAVVTGKGGRTLAAFDLKAGTRTPFDFTLPERWTKSPYSRWLEPHVPLYLTEVIDASSHGPSMPVAWDATKGELYAADRAAIYRVPAGKAAAWKPTWEAVP
jgi:hypothetical protein